MVVMGGLMLAILLGALEQTIVAVALPAIAGQLDGFALMGWVVSAYLVASTVVTPIYGKLSDLHGRRAMLRARLKIPRDCDVKGGCGKKTIENARQSWLARASVTRAT